jgi:N-formylglutamate amidohydrolase
MKLINSNSDRQIKINIETDFQANAGWEDNLSEFENEILKLTDWYTDDLFYSNEDEMIIAPFSRIFS